MTRQCSSCGGFCKKSGCECENVPIITSSDVIAGLQMALSQAEAMIERQQHVMQRDRRLKAVRVDGWVSRAPDEGMAKRQRKRT